MTKAKIVAALAEKVAIPKRTSEAYLKALAQLAQAETKSGLTIPGVGKLTPRGHKVRMGRSPRTGESVKVARKDAKFVVARAAKGSTGKAQTVLDVFSRTYRKLG